MPRQASEKPLAKTNTVAPLSPDSDAPASTMVPADLQTLLQALQTCDPLDGRALHAFLALDGRQRRIVRSLIAELARNGRRRGRTGA